MKKIRRLLFRLLLLALLVMAVIFTYNTMTFSSQQIKVDAVEPIKIEDAAVDRLANAVRIPTLSHDDHVDLS